MKRVNPTYHITLLRNIIFKGNQNADLQTNKG